jgi:metal-responsive CopG/Arc/MetJ family transcriptional regulator
MARKQVLVQLDDAQVAALDRLASSADESRSELIRRAIELYIEATNDHTADLRYAAAYERLPEDPDELADLRTLAFQAWPQG